MVTYKTLQEFLDKCIDATGKIDEVYKEKSEQMEILQEDLRLMDLQRAAVQGQIETLNQLIDIENNPPSVELPFAHDQIEELFEKRLEGPEGMSPEEVHKIRQEKTYLTEALNAVEDIDAINSEEIASGKNSEVDS